MSSLFIVFFADAYTFVLDLVMILLHSMSTHADNQSIEAVLLIIVAIYLIFVIVFIVFF